MIIWRNSKLKKSTKGTSFSAEGPRGSKGISCPDIGAILDLCFEANVTTGYRKEVVRKNPI
jgi:hypothetical protein